MYEDSQKERSAGLAYLLWFGWMIGLCGLHRFYLKRYISGVFWLLTFGCFFIGQLIDLFWIPGRTEDLNARAQLRRPSRAPRRGTPMKPCPDCGEQIAGAARLCRHCGADLTQPKTHEDRITISECPECGHILEVPSHLIGVRGKCEHCLKEITPYATVM